MTVPKSRQESRSTSPNGSAFVSASELSDKLLAEILEPDAELTVTMHIQTLDQLKAIKTIKGKISDIGRMKAGEQEMLFDRQDILTEDVMVEVRCRAVIRTDSGGSDYEGIGW